MRQRTSTSRLETSQGGSLRPRHQPALRPLRTAGHRTPPCKACPRRMTNILVVEPNSGSGFLFLPAECILVSQVPGPLGTSREADASYPCFVVGEAEESYFD